MKSNHHNIHVCRLHTEQLEYYIYIYIYLTMLVYANLLDPEYKSALTPFIVPHHTP